ncbi:MAG: hypothetical protein RIR18_534 [Pseudomonadota bacterium]
MKFSNRLAMLVSIGLLNSAGLAIAAPDLLWLSDTAPKKSKPVATHNHASGSEDAVMSGDEADTIHTSVKHLWVRQGDELAKAAYLGNDVFPSALAMLDAKGKRSEAQQSPQNGTAHVKLEYQEMGFNNAYARRELLAGQTLRVQVAKAEVLKGSCCEREVAPEQLKAFSDAEQPLEIVRERMEKEKLFTRIVSGDVIKFTVLSKGQPATGVPVVMMTQQGWQKKSVSNEEGKVEFTMIRDYFPSWDDFRRRTKETFVVSAELEKPESGVFQGQKYNAVRYEATLSGKYAPSPYDYKSYSFGLGIAVFVLAFGGLGVYLYRRRRVKPFQEIRFEEKKD